MRVHRAHLFGDLISTRTEKKLTRGVRSLRYVRREDRQSEIDDCGVVVQFIEMEFEGNDTGFLLSEIEMRAWFSNVVEGKNGGGRGVVIG
nr:hypothetical protein Iba_chr11eCG0320 [Ipomoea batatas]